VCEHCFSRVSGVQHTCVRACACWRACVRVFTSFIIFKQHEVRMHVCLSRGRTHVKHRKAVSRHPPAPPPASLLSHTHTHLLEHVAPDIMAENSELGHRFYVSVYLRAYITSCLGMSRTCRRCGTSVFAWSGTTLVVLELTWDSFEVPLNRRAWLYTIALLDMNDKPHPYYTDSNKQANTSASMEEDMACPLQNYFERVIHANEECMRK
jgi:hypothetical protein